MGKGKKPTPAETARKAKEKAEKAAKKAREEDELDQIKNLRLMGYSWRDIEAETEINYETARTQYKRAQKRILKEKLDFKMTTHIAEDLARYNLLIKEAWRGWVRSVGDKQKVTTENKGVAVKEDEKTGRQTAAGIYLDSLDIDPEQYASLVQVKEKILEWADAGDNKFLDTIRALMHDRNELVGAYEKDRDDDDQVEVVRLEQKVYIPGIGDLTPELIMQLMQAVPPMPEPDDD